LHRTPSKHETSYDLDSRLASSKLI